MRAHHHKATLLTAILSMALAGCGISAPLTIKDTSAPSASARAVVRVGEDKRGGIEGEYTRLRAEGTQTTDYITTVFGTDVPGNAVLSHTARVDRIFLGYNRLLFGDRPFEMEWYAGAAGERITWTTVTAAAASPLGARQSAVGLSGGVLGRWKLGEPWAIEARVRGVTGRINGSRTELAVAVRPVRAVRVRLGYAQDTVYTRVKDAATRLELTSRGPFVALGVELD